MNAEEPGDYNSYPAYKDSGVVWLGEIPEHWEPRRLKTIIAQAITDGPHETPEFLPEGIPFLSVDGIQNGELVFEGCRFISNEAHLNYRRKCFPRHDDILLGKAASTGKIARVKVDFEFGVWSPLALIRADAAKIDPQYLEFALKGPLTQAQIDILCTSNTQKNISMGDIPKLVVALPPLSEQQAIGRFLDHKTSEIDTLIAAKQRLITLLKEKRAALITHAVTKGLDPVVPMKDSGIEWLGQIPAHWEMKRLKHVSPNLTVGIVVNPSNYVSDDGVPFLYGSDIKEGQIVTEGARRMSREWSDALLKSQLHSGDLVTVRVGAPGITAVVPNELEGVNCASILIIRRSQAFNSYWLSYTMNSRAVRYQVELVQYGAAQEQFNVAHAVEFLVPYPPLEEQTKITGFLDQKAGEIDHLIDSIKEVIERLQEYRTALISVAVTGKIDVRNAT